VSELGADKSGPPVGYRSPPRQTRFQKGASGNPKGRPRNRKKEIPYDTVLGQMVTIREDGRERRVTAAEAFLLHLTRKGLAGDNAASRASLAAIELARARRGIVDGDHITVIRIVAISFGVGSILATLGMGKKVFPRDQDRVRWLLNPWIIEAALQRLGSRQLDLGEQKEVWDSTRTPDKVNWPVWWSYRGE
jgi:hypothetical protein